MYGDVQIPINDLVYGYGGVKLFPTQALRDANDWRIDFTTSLQTKKDKKVHLRLCPK